MGFNIWCRRKKPNSLAEVTAISMEPFGITERHTKASMAHFLATIIPSLTHANITKFIMDEKIIDGSFSSSNIVKQRKRNRLALASCGSTV